MEENAERIEGLCCEAVRLCSDASSLLLSRGGSFACWDTLAGAGGEKRREQLAMAIAELLVVQGKAQEALSKSREAWRLVQEAECVAAAA